MGGPQFASDDCKMSPWSPHVQPEIFLKIEHCIVIVISGYWKYETGLFIVLYLNY